MTDRQVTLIKKINDYVEYGEDDLYLDFDDYRELNILLQKNIALVLLCENLYNAADMLCDRMTDFPAGCDACCLWDEDDGSCYFKEVRKKYEELIG